MVLMAFVTFGNGAGFFATVQVMDKGEEKASLTVELRSATHAAAVTDMATWVTNFLAVSDCEVLGYNIQQRYVNDAIIIPAAGQLQEKARVAFRLEGTSEYETLDIPAPKATIFLNTNGANSEIVDTADASLVTYTNMYKSTGIAFISDGEALEQISRGERVSTRKGMRRGR
jgi:succinyl-CoA synthetase beta subunit